MRPRGRAGACPTASSERRIPVLPATRSFRPAVLELESRLVPAVTVASFSSGLWEYRDTTGQWSQLTGAVPSSFVVDSNADVVGVFSSALWEYSSSSGWRELT